MKIRVPEGRHRTPRCRGWSSAGRWVRRLRAGLSPGVWPRQKRQHKPPLAHKQNMSGRAVSRREPSPYQDGAPPRVERYGFNGRVFVAAGGPARDEKGGSAAGQHDGVTMGAFALLGVELGERPGRAAMGGNELEAGGRAGHDGNGPILSPTCPAEVQNGGDDRWEPTASSRAERRESSGCSEQPISLGRDLAGARQPSVRPALFLVDVSLPSRSGLLDRQMMVQ